MKKYMSSFSAIYVALALCQCTAFLLSNDCPAPSPCTCASSSNGNDIYIYCSARNLTSVPQFEQDNITVNSLTIFLNSNSLTLIPNFAFRYLNSINASSIELQLRENHIHMIENDAFKDGEKITSLKLQNNNLTSIPSALSKLTNLQSLDVSENPLRSIDALVMVNIGRSLKSLQIDLRDFTEWPTDLHYLRTLQSLEVNNIPFAHLDINAFRGFGNTITMLIMNNSKLEKIPYAICRLSHLETLVFSHSSNLNEKTSSIFEPCGHTVPSVKNLGLHSNHLQNFPDMFTVFPSLSYLACFDNEFQYIDSAVLPTDSNFTYIILQGNMFERIPSALNKLRYLSVIDLRFNKIRTVESMDLYGLLYLKELYLDNNPIAYIESDAFSHNTGLFLLMLNNTQLLHIPKAITYLPNLKTFELSPIDCTCEMSYLKNWNVSAITYFNTLCVSSTETIKTFVMYSLQSCR